MAIVDPNIPKAGTTASVGWKSGSIAAAQSLVSALYHEQHPERHKRTGHSLSRLGPHVPRTTP